MPTEVHEHFDADGNKTGHTVVTRESAWDDDARGRALRLAEYEASICQCGCGLPIRIAHDATQVFAVEDYVCHAGRAIQQARRLASNAAKQDKKPDGWDDGLYYLARPATPEEDKRRAH